MYCRLVRSILATVGALTLGLGAAWVRPAGACTIDFVPSATAAGRTAIVYDVSPGEIDPSHYATFIFPGSFGAGWSIRLAELSRGLALSSRELRAPWRWVFGDGTTAMGHIVTHTYHRPGMYVLNVWAIVPNEAEPFPFDQILVPVLAPEHILATETPKLLQGSRFSPASVRVGGLQPLQHEVHAGAIAVARQTLAQIESSAWASIRDYWLHTRGRLPPAYAYLDSLLRQESLALDAQNRDRASAIADTLLTAWARLKA
jgi:hypothetical protein